jgi:hypothetical protein
MTAKYFSIAIYCSYGIQSSLYTIYNSTPAGAERGHMVLGRVKNLGPLLQSERNANILIYLTNT